jgi:2-polyprenyl-3-methyl-5-hydroxy-6-metoxy-1,4-benzoquinol methylase
MTMDSLDGIEGYAERHRHFFGDEVPALLRECLDADGIKTILDAGCGDGALVRALHDGGYLGEGRELWACDLSKSRVERVQRSGASVRAFVDDVEELREVPDGAIDLFVSSQVIEHVDDARMIRAIERVTRPGSTIYVSTVFKRWYAWYFYRSPAGWALDPTHLREYRRDAELLDKFPSSTFRLKKSLKTPVAYPIGDAVLRATGTAQDVYLRSELWRALRRVRVPILGYKIWEVVLERL